MLSLLKAPSPNCNSNKQICSRLRRPSKSSWNSDHLQRKNISLSNPKMDFATNHQKFTISISTTFEQKFWKEALKIWIKQEIYRTITIVFTAITFDSVKTCVSFRQCIHRYFHIISILRTILFNELKNKEYAKWLTQKNIIFWKKFEFNIQYLNIELKLNIWKKKFLF